MLLGGVELALLTEDIRQADVQVAGGAQRRADMTLGRFERALVQPSGLVGPAPSQPHLGQDDRGAELIGELSCRVQAADGIGERVDRGDEVAGGPGCQAEEPRRGSTRTHGRRCRPGPRHVGVCDGAIDIPSGLRDGGPVDGDHGRKPSQLRVARVRQRGQPRRPREVGKRNRPLPQCCLGRVEPGLDRVQVAFGKAGPGVRRGKHRTTAFLTLGQRAEPVAQRAVLALPAELRQTELHEVSGEHGVVPGQGMVKASAGMPAAEYQPAAAR